jgi:hypothetical protein
LTSDLQRVAQGLVECLDDVPSIVAHLRQTATRLRQQASWIADLAGANPYGRMAALELDAAARACDDAAHRASLAPPMARTWAVTMVTSYRGDS